MKPSISSPRLTEAGFTLIELMITVAIIGILAGIALPSYLSSVVKARRADVQREMVSYAQALERYYTTNGRYVTVAAGNVCGANAPANSSFYTFSVTTDAAGATAGCADNTFVIRATPVNTSSQKDDGNLTLDNAGTKTGKWVK